MQYQKGYLRYAPAAGGRTCVKKFTALRYLNAVAVIPLYKLSSYEAHSVSNTRVSVAIQFT